jgi:hypothetical protein
MIYHLTHLNYTQACALSAKTRKFFGLTKFQAISSNQKYGMQLHPITLANKAKSPHLIGGDYKVSLSSFADTKVLYKTVLGGKRCRRRATPTLFGKRTYTSNSGQAIALLHLYSTK